jgi:hypothetical protein
MSSYVKSTDFQAKDSLLTGDPNKIIKGAEINDEFNAIQTAVATKGDISSPTFLGNPTAPTQDVSNSSTRLATTAFVKAALALLHPVGSIYIAVVSTNPATLFGFGTWVAFGAGKTIVGLDSGDTLFDTVKETGGSKNAIVVSHTHGITDPGHTHTAPLFRSNGSIDGSSKFGAFTDNDARGSGTTDSSTTGITINTSGSTGTNANLPPYIVVYMWERTA